MKNSTILILKGVLFYGTALSTILFIGGIDSIYNKGINRWLRHYNPLAMISMTKYKH